MGSTEVPRAEAYEFLRGWQRQLLEGGFIGAHLAQGVRRRRG